MRALASLSPHSSLRSGFNSRTGLPLRVQFVFYSLPCSESFYLVFLFFLPPHKPTPQLPIRPGYSGLRATLSTTKMLSSSSLKSLSSSPSLAQIIFIIIINFLIFSQDFERLMITTWGHDPGIVSVSNVLLALNDALSHSAVLVQVSLHYYRLLSEENQRGFTH